MISGILNTEKFNNLCYNYLMAFTVSGGSITLICTISILTGRIDSSRVASALILLSFVGFISFAYLGEKIYRVSKEKLNKLYRGTEWVTPEGKIGKVDDVRDFGRAFILSFADGTTSREETFLVSSTGSSRHLIKGLHMGEISANKAVDVVRDRIKADRLHLTIAAICTILAAVTFGATSNELPDAPFKMIMCISVLFFGWRSFRLVCDLTYCSSVRDRLSKAKVTDSGLVSGVVA